MTERTNDMAVVDAAGDVANSPVASYVPTEKSVESGGFIAAWEEIKFLFTTREGLVGNYELVYRFCFHARLDFADRRAVAMRGY